MNRPGPACSFVVPLIISGMAAARAPAAWMVQEIPLLPSWSGSVEVAGISSNGVVCGTGNYVANASSAVFRFDGTTVTELPHLTPSDPISLARGINVHGIICGQSHRSDGKERAVYWEDTTLHVIPYAADCNTNSYCQALGINDAGVIVGLYWKTDGERAAFYYQDGATYSLDAIIRAGGLAGLQSANAVNEHNVICGVADDAGGFENVWTYDLGSTAFTLVGRIGMADSSAVGMNALGQTIGRGKVSSADPYIQALTYDGSWHVVDAAELGSQWGVGINDRGRMVGNTGSSSSRVSWYSDAPGSGSMKHLTLPGWTRVTATGINNRDWIVGYGRTATSGTDTRGFILKPPPGDSNHDGVVQAADYAQFAACLSGPVEDPGTIPPGAACLAAFDFEPADGDVDLADFGAFQAVYEGL
jgi:probable HAF family extracellular repeat protein